MKHLALMALFALVMVSACVVTPAPPEYGGGVVVSPLPAIVVLGVEPYYQQDSYVYYYHDNRWSYSRSRRGPWSDLPRSHWPRETRRNDDHHNRDKHGDDYRDKDYRYDHDKR
jgi:hypothetical protein